MYAALLENSTFDKADTAYTVLENYYIDWNEIRVCSLRELADTLTDLPHPEAAADRVRKALQGIFEKTYMFDLEELRKKGKALAEHIKTLDSMSAGTPYMIQYTAQVALDGHLIPLDEASLRIMRRLNLSQVSNDGKQEICIGLDRVILKKSSLTFAAQLHHFAAGYYDIPDSPELLAQLSAIDPEAVNRSWTSPALASPPSAQSPSPGATPTSRPVGESAKVTKKVEFPKTPTSPAEKSKASSKSVPVKPAPPLKPVKSVKLPAKQATKPVIPVSLKPATKMPKKPIQKKSVPKNLGKVTANVKKTPTNALKGSPGKKVLPKKQVPKRIVKSVAPKKKVGVKQNPAKPLKKPKSVSLSKALRKKKPK